MLESKSAASRICNTSQEIACRIYFASFDIAEYPHHIFYSSLWHVAFERQNNLPVPFVRLSGITFTFASYAASSSFTHAHRSTELLRCLQCDHRIGARCINAARNVPSQELMAWIDRAFRAVQIGQVEIRFLCCRRMLPVLATAAGISMRQRRGLIGCREYHKILITIRYANEEKRKTKTNVRRDETIKGSALRCSTTLRER